MTPTNPDNSQPLVYRILDSLGVAHLVAPVNHTHSQSEVDGLTAALAAKADKVSGATNNNFASLDGNGNLKDSGKKASDFMPTMPVDDVPHEDSDDLVTSGGVYMALELKADANHTHTGIESTQSSVTCEGSIGHVDIDARTAILLAIQDKDAAITYQTIDNLNRALSNPDAAPTLNSDKLVTSGGIYNAINNIGNVTELSLSGEQTISPSSLESGKTDLVVRSNASNLSIADGFSNMFGAKWAGTVSKNTISNWWIFRYYAIPNGVANPLPLIEIVYASTAM